MIILASQSPRRKKLLEQMNLKFTVEPSSCDESYDDNEDPADIVQMLALRKAMNVSEGKSAALIIGADTIVVFNDRILGKPDSQTAAKTMLSSLSGNSHYVLTGVALVKTDKESNILEKKTFYEETKVFFGNLTMAEIDNYVDGGSPMDKAGSYGIQDDWGAFFVKRIEGDYYNVVGLPLHALYRHLKAFDPEIMPLNSFKVNHD